MEQEPTVIAYPISVQYSCYICVYITINIVHSGVLTLYIYITINIIHSGVLTLYVTSTW